MHIVFYYPSQSLGGQQTQLVQIIEKLTDMGHIVSWLYQFEGELTEQIKRVADIHKIQLPVYNQIRPGILRPLNRWLYYSIGAKQVAAYCRRHDVAAVLSSNTPDSIMLGKVSKKAGIPHFRMLGGSMIQVEPHWMEKYERLGIDDSVTGYFAWPAVFEELRTANISEDKFIEMPFAVNVERFHPLPQKQVQEVRNKLGIRPGELVIGWVGRVALNMQVWNTVRMLEALLQKGYRNFRFLCVGGGPDMEQLKTMIREIGLEDYSILTGWIHYDKMNEMINAMDIVPLLEEDPQGGSIVREAMACGKVALSVNGISGTQDWFMKEECSILVEPDDYINLAANSIIELAKNKQRMYSIGDNARKYVEDYLQFSNQAQIIIDAINEEN